MILLAKRKLILYGCGKTAEMWLECLGSERIYCFADSDSYKCGKTVGEKRVLSIDELCEIKGDSAIFISTAIEHKADIYRKLSEKHLTEKVVGAPYLDQELFFHWNTQIDTLSRFEGRNTLLSGVRVSQCQMGYASYISPNSVLRNVKIGRYSSIGPNVKNVLGQHPTRKFVSTHPIFYSTQQTIHKSFVKKNIYEEYRFTKGGYSAEIGNDVWIGDGASIMEGITVADGTIVAAGANVVRDTEPYSIVGGNPARIIRYRFSKEEIQFLVQIQWWNKSVEWITNHAKYFTDIKEFIRIVQKEKI